MLLCGGLVLRGVLRLRVGLVLRGVLRLRGVLVLRGRLVGLRNQLP